MAEERQNPLPVPACAPVSSSAGAALRRGDGLVSKTIDGILRGERTILAQAITLIESSREADRVLAEQILEACLPHCGRSIRVAITGVPGVGKSCVIEALGSYLTTELGEKVAVLAIDPSSQISGGSILADKTRMEGLATSALAFVRPSPSRGALGGVALRTREAMLLCEAAGYRNILVETVGVGQSEVAVRNMVDFFLLLGLARAGDGLQGIKRGVMELADLVAINKADGDNVDAAERARNDAQNALHFFSLSPSGWVPRALVCSARTGKRIGELWACVQEYVNLTEQNGWFVQARRNQARSWMQEIVDEELRRRFEANPAIQARKSVLEKELLEGRITSFAAARDLLKLYSDPFGAEGGRAEPAPCFEPQPPAKG